MSCHRREKTPISTHALNIWNNLEASLNGKILLSLNQLKTPDLRTYVLFRVAFTPFCLLLFIYYFRFLCILLFSVVMEFLWATF